MQHKQWKLLHMLAEEIKSYYVLEAKQCLIDR